VLARLFAGLPPLWGVVLLLVGLTLPQALLGLPVAAAAVGPLPALGVLVAIGAVMIVAAAAEGEALVRDGAFRREGGYFGKLVERYLGRRATVVPDGVALLRTSLSVLGAYVGLSVTLAALTGAPREVWGVVALVAIAVLLLRGGLRIPAAVGAALGLACLPLIVAICAIAVAHGGGDLGLADDPSAASLGGVVGLAVMLYISNVYVVQIARETLPRAPDGRALVLGSALGTALVTAIAAGWLLATSAALRSEDLSGEVGTVLGPLATETGAAVTVLGTVLTLLLLGLGIERTSLSVMNLVAERLPGRGRLLPALVPLGVCLLGEGLLAADAVSFSGVFGVAGIATNVLLAIALPLLLLLAARRTGDLLPGPGAVVPLFGAPAAVWSVVGAAVVLLALFATVLSDKPLLRVAAALSLVALAATAAIARRSGAFDERGRRRPDPVGTPE
jgi:hypothetical protein